MGKRSRVCLHVVTHRCIDYAESGQRSSHAQQLHILYCSALSCISVELWHLKYFFFYQKEFHLPENLKISNIKSGNLFVTLFFCDSNLHFQTNTDYSQFAKFIVYFTECQSLFCQLQFLLHHQTQVLSFLLKHAK